MMVTLTQRIDRLARWTAGPHAAHPVATESSSTRRDLLAGATVATTLLVAPRFLASTPARAASTGPCRQQCDARAEGAIADGQKGCDAAAADFAKEVQKVSVSRFVFSSAFARMQYQALCYEGVLLRAAAEKLACVAACARGSTPASVARSTRPPIAPPPPPPPPSCPEGTLFCTVGAGGGDICCLGGYTCCGCGVCCVPAVKCACCG